MYFASRLLFFFMTPFYTRVLTKVQYGSYSMIYTLVPFLIVLYSYGMETGYFYFVNKEKENEGRITSTAFTSLLYSSILFSVVLILISPLLGSFVSARPRTDLVVFAAIILALDNIAVLPFAYLRKHERPLRFASIRMLNIVVNIFFNVFFLVFCPYITQHSTSGALYAFASALYDPNDPVKYAILSNVLSSLFTLFLLIPELKKIKWQWNKEIFQRMLKYSWPLLILGFAGVINETFDRTLLRFRLPDLQSLKGLSGIALEKARELNNNYKFTQIGIYSACYKISIFMTLAIQSFRFAAEPFFFRQMRETNSTKMYATVLKYFSFVTGFIFLGVLLYLPIVLKILGKDFRSGQDIIPILLLANLFLGLFLYLSQWYKQTEKVLYGAYISIGGAVITLIINFAFIPSYGYMASAWATLAAYASMAIASYITGQRHFYVDYPVIRIGFYIWFALILFVISRLMLDSFFGDWTLGAYFFNTLLAGIYLFAFVAFEQVYKRVILARRR